MNRWLTSRLAGRAARRGDELVRRSDAVAAAIDRVTAAHWAELLRGLRPGLQHMAGNHAHALAIMRRLPLAIWQALRRGLAGVLLWAHDDAARSMTQTLPLAYMRAAALRRHAPLRESALLEAGGALAFGWFQPDDVFDVQDLAAPLRHEPGFPFGDQPPEDLDPEEERSLFRSLLFAPPGEADVRRILDLIAPGPDYRQRSGSPTPEALAGILAGETAAGKSMRQIASILRPHFEGSKVAARRAARTFGQYIGTERNLDTSEALGELVIGYEVRDPGGPTARPDHMRRSGTKYFRRPEPGQLGLDVMPHPPYDRGGPNENKRGLRWNCRCFLLPLLAGIS